MTIAIAATSSAAPINRHLKNAATPSLVRSNGRRQLSTMRGGVDNINHHRFNEVRADD